MGAIYIELFYFILSALGLIYLLISVNRKMKIHDSL